MNTDHTGQWRPSPDVLDRYFAGIPSAIERAHVDAWMSANPRDAELEQAIVRVAAAPHAETATVDAEAVLERIYERFATTKRQAFATPDEQSSSRGLRVRRNGFTASYSIRTRLVAFVGALSLVVIGYLGWRANASTPQAARLYVTGPGERRAVQLSDRTIVTLAPQTVMRVGAGFGTAHRDVAITGQAHFEVQTSSRTPFLVHTGDVTSRVLGTTFMVRHFGGDREVVVAVQSGKVMTGRSHPVMLTNNMVARITDSTIVLTTDADLREYMEWRDGQLFFTKAPAAEVAKVIGQWYGLTFQFTDSTMLVRSLSGVFDDHDSRQEVLQNLQILLGAQMTFDGNVVTLAPKHKSAPPPGRREIREERSSIPTEVGR